MSWPKHHSNGPAKPTSYFRFNETASPALDAMGRLSLTVTGGTFNGDNIAITAGSMVASTAAYMTAGKKFTGYLKFIPNTTSPFSTDFIGFINPVFTDATSYSWYIDPNGGGNGLVLGMSNGLDGGDYGFQLDTGDIGLDTSTIFHVMFGYMETTNGGSRAFIYVYKASDPIGTYTKVTSNSMYSSNAANTDHRLHLNIGTFYKNLQLDYSEYSESVDQFTNLIRGRS